MEIKKEIERKCNWKKLLLLVLCLVVIELSGMMILQRQLIHIFQSMIPLKLKNDETGTIFVQKNAIRYMSFTKSLKSTTSSAVSINSRNETKLKSDASVKSQDGRCPEISPKLVGSMTVNNTSPSYEDLQKLYPWVEPGGRYAPPECISRHKVAIIIPYRNRERHLKTLLLNLHPFLRRQMLDYRIFVINQEEGSKFNRAMLMNIGFTEALQIYNYTCFVFHDVDLIPEDDRNTYRCFEMPRHLSVAVDKFEYKLPYPQIFGGVTAFSKDDFERTNGYSNLFFGWGGEDDDMFKRILNKNMKIVRFPKGIARYKMISHISDRGNEENLDRFILLHTGKERFEKDGLGSLEYKLQEIELRKMYTWISVKINEGDMIKRIRSSWTFIRSKFLRTLGFNLS